MTVGLLDGCTGVVQDGCTGVGIPGGYQSGYTGEYYPATLLLGEGPYPAERAPEGLQDLEWVGMEPGVTGDGGGDGYDHPAGPVGHPCPPCHNLADCRLLANNGEIPLHFL